MEHNSCTFRTAITTFRGAARPTCDNVRVDISTPAPRQDDVILICDSDSQNMASATAHIFTDMLHPAVRIFNSVLFSPWMCQSKPHQQLLPEAEDRLWTSLRLELLGVMSAELSSSKTWDRDCCFQQQGFPIYCSFIRDWHTADLRP